MSLQKEKEQPSCEKNCADPKSMGKKRCEIKGGGQEMTVMVGQWQRF